MGHQLQLELLYGRGLRVRAISKAARFLWQVVVRRGSHSGHDQHGTRWALPTKPGATHIARTLLGLHCSFLLMWATAKTPSIRLLFLTCSIRSPLD